MMKNVVFRLIVSTRIFLRIKIVCLLYLKQKTKNSTKQKGDTFYFLKLLFSMNRKFVFILLNMS